MDEAEVEQLSIEVLALELHKAQRQVQILAKYLDKVEPFWRNRLSEFFENEA